ncbi:hypothetical protein PHMEG_00032877 [Phytophthora megakarya]|uniref:Reverse transcriptase/retrotransposon-derived protein RNase H-like domain-containing protein n=1 Tax=Phytophthora megakarya TaxID=4795 RepID=A0A225UV02_9STRA|nr:hypothetical protein PHMEG_00032877 [Phytophthora megakarya]
MATITELSFPKTKRGMQQFLGALNYYSRFIQDFAVFGAALYQLKDNLSAAKETLRVLQRKVADAPILMHFDDKKEVHVICMTTNRTQFGSVAEFSKMPK